MVKHNTYFDWKFLVALLIFGFWMSGSFALTPPSPKPVVVEITGRIGVKLLSKPLVAICKEDSIPVTDVYEWSNHLIIYGELKDTLRLKKQIMLKYAACKVKVYAHPFYDFDRKYCSNMEVAKEWDNIILTADLVADPKMQQQYLEYHRTQFQYWPEVSNGFCHADFQQLLVFKNGRQLMLIISIPKGQSLDKLNPKTTENNPRVNDWNKMMARYQEGIPGTKKGEVWVFFKPVS